MKKILLLLAVCCLLLTSGLALADTATFQGVTLDTSVDYVNIDKITKIKDWNALVDFLKQFPNLQRCDMYGVMTHRKEADLLAENFPDVQFGWTLQILGCDRRHVFRNDVTAWSTLHSRKTRYHHNIDFEIFKYCPNLLALDIGHNAVDDVSFLRYLPNLRVLIIACNYIVDITPVGELKDLEYLEIFKNKITDISPLANLTNLLDLDICFNYIKDWSPLKNLTQLQRLWIYNSNDYTERNPVPKSVVAELKEALPNTYLDSTHYSTAGGWRKHPHYYVIAKMFKDAVYIPFEESRPITDPNHPMYAGDEMAESVAAAAAVAAAPAETEPEEAAASEALTAGDPAYDVVLTLPTGDKSAEFTHPVD